MNRNAPLFSLAAISVILLGGCGKAEYESRMQSRIGGLAFESKFLEGLHADMTDALDGVASLRLPKAIDDEAVVLRRGQKDQLDQPMAPHRIEPSFTRLPGFQYTLERWVNVGGRNDYNPIYCHFAMVPTSEKSAQAVAAEITRAARRKFKSAGFQTVELDRPDKTKLTAQKMSIRGQLRFDTDSSGGDAKNIAGRCDIYIYSGPQHHVIVAFRASDAANSKVQVIENGALAVGTIQMLAGDDAA